MCAQLSYAETADEYFKQGVIFSEANDHNAALKFYKRAVLAGLNTSVLQYNSAVSYYKLSRYEEARKEFLILINDARFEQLAYFNLGLVANKQKDEAAAVRWFKRAYRNGDDDKIRTLSTEALYRLGASNNGFNQVTRRWKGTVSGAVVSDSNVALVNEELAGVASESDTSIDVYASIGRWIRGGNNDGLHLGFSLYQQKYTALNFYDTAQYSARLKRYGRIGDWRVLFGAHWDEVFFGGESYQRIISAEMRARKYLSKYNQLHYRYKIGSINVTNSVYNYTEGWRHQLRLGFSHRDAENRLRFYYQLENNDRNDFRGVTTFTSYSPMRHTLRATGWWDFSRTWALNLDGRYRYSQYNNAHILNSGQSIRRIDEQLRLSVKLTYQLARHWKMNTQFIYTANESNINQASPDPSYGYTRSLLKAAIHWSF